MGVDKTPYHMVDYCLEAKEHLKNGGLENG